MQFILADLIDASRATHSATAHVSFQADYNTKVLQLFLRGLRDPLRSWVRTVAPTTFHEACEEASREEPSILPNSISTVSQPNAQETLNQSINHQNYSPQQLNNRNTGKNRPRQYSDNQGRGNQQAINITCYKCGLGGHTADRCFVRVNHQQPPQRQSFQSQRTNYQQPQRNNYLQPPQRNNYTQQPQRNAARAIMPSVTCYVCGNNGHYANECPQKLNQAKRNQNRPSCGYCGLINHTENQCIKKTNAQINQSGSAQINLLSVKEPLSHLPISPNHLFSVENYL